MEEMNYEKMVIEMIDILVDMSEETFNEAVENFDNMNASESLQKFLDELVWIAENRRAKKGVA